VVARPVGALAWRSSAQFERSPAIGTLREHRNTVLSSFHAQLRDREQLKSFILSHPISLAQVTISMTHRTAGCKRPLSHRYSEGRAGQFQSAFRCLMVRIPRDLTFSIGTWWVISTRFWMRSNGKIALQATRRSRARAAKLRMLRDIACSNLNSTIVMP